MYRSLIRVTALAWLLAVGCDGEVSLGRWARGAGPSSTQTPPSRASGESSGPLVSENHSDAGTTGAESLPRAGDAGDTLPQRPACLEALGYGAASAVAETLYVAEASTDWSLSEPTAGFEWTLTIEQDVPNSPPTVGYYWHLQFSFLPGVAGRLGLQTQGVYQADPLTNPNSTETAHMAVFWLSGPPTAAELGDIAHPDARVAPQTAAGLSWQTIHAKFDWQECHTYRFRFAVESTNEEGDIWYGVWITDETTRDVTFLGRMLLPADTGLISPFISSRSEQIVYAPTSCAQLHSSSAIFGAPTPIEGGVASHEADRFAPPFGCRPSRIQDFSGAVRHQMAVTP